jgi:putative transposase
VYYDGEVLESYVTTRRDRKVALKFLRKSMKRYGATKLIVTDKLRSYGTAMKVIGDASKQETGRWLNNMAKNSHLPRRPQLGNGCSAFGRCEVCKNSSPSIL